MSTTELRNIITDRLSHIDDVSFLNAIKTIIESKASGNNYQLSEYEKSRIDKARKDLKGGKTISHQDLQNEISKWMSEK